MLLIMGVGDKGIQKHEGWKPQLSRRGSGLGIGALLHEKALFRDIASNSETKENP
jgi:hypothetical protein